ncbi:MAG: dihydroorotase [Bacteroidales bacterium]|jgi:dihydroorotase|nr:dihydroorotase [Bacteroidales bacterium]
MEEFAPSQLIKNVVIVNEGVAKKGAVLIRDGKIADIFEAGIPEELLKGNVDQYDAEGHYLLPGVIDDQVHFREPGWSSKGDIFSESRAAVAGGVTSFMDMPNTFPQTITQEALSAKFERAREASIANYSFYIGATNDNMDEVLKTDFSKVCGVKMFMGASTGNMLVDNPESLETIFRQTPALLAVHCEKEDVIRKNTALFKERYGEDMPVSYHPLVRSEEACYASSLQAVELAKKYDTRLHILHLSTARETSLFSNELPLAEKRITAEVCVHHLWFSDADYERYGTAIKWNPAIKTAADRDGLLKALLDGTIDVVATDHAPHTWDEKQRGYFQAPSGGPLIQHSLTVMLEMAYQKRITMEQVVEKMCHCPAILFGIKQRGFIRKGYWADLVLVDANNPWTVAPENILYKCKWSPFNGQTFHTSVLKTWVNGNLVYDGKIREGICGKALEF